MVREHITKVPAGPMGNQRIRPGHVLRPFGLELPHLARNAPALQVTERGPVTSQAGIVVLKHSFSERTASHSDPATAQAGSQARMAQGPSTRR
jgi:hypothetical protein